MEIEEGGGVEMGSRGVGGWPREAGGGGSGGGGGGDEERLVGVLMGEMKWR